MALVLKLVEAERGWKFLEDRSDGLASCNVPSDSWSAYSPASLQEGVTHLPSSAPDSSCQGDLPKQV